MCCDIYDVISFATVDMYFQWNSSVVEPWTIGWMVGGSSPLRGWEFLSSPPRPDWLCGTPSLLFNGYRGLFPWG
jgi:hypothetical protein